jgi:hypothetical protein
VARHYQWYPFVNLGHYLVAQNSDSLNRRKFIGFIKKGIEAIHKRGKDNGFYMGIPFIWCSNNLVVAALTQLRLYHKLTGDTQYNEMEAALRDWLFGCNPWGTSMVIGYPDSGDTPVDPHSALSAVFNLKINGGLIDGPVYTSIFNRLKDCHDMVLSQPAQAHARGHQLPSSRFRRRTWGRYHSAHFSVHFVDASLQCEVRTLQHLEEPR